MFSSALLLIFALLLVSLAIQRVNVYTPARLLVVDIGGTSILLLLVLRQWFEEFLAILPGQDLAKA